VLRQYGAAPNDDLPALWRRLAFNILVSNTDDHLRNHGFLYGGPNGWRLSPAFDLNPVPIDRKPRVLTTPVTPDGDPTASLELALEAARQFDLTAVKARRIAAEVGAAVANWREVAASLRAPAKEIDQMSSAFEHGDLMYARSAHGSQVTFEAALAEVPDVEPKDERDRLD
jgi:serine/threonine-protein kinase HipA